MQVLKKTPFEFGFLTWQLEPPATSLVLVVKATFDIVDGGVCTIAEKQVPCGGEVFYDDDSERSLRYDTDFAILKPRGECHLVGTCHAPNGVAVPATTVSFMIGSVQQSFAVIGDRQWTPSGVPSAPTPFVTMPLCYERAFGGKGFTRNPVGAGIDPVDTPKGPVRPLPNLENPQRLISAMSHRPDPVGAFPIPRMWPSRLDRAGTYDRRWLAQRWPWLPEDFDFAYFNSAPVAMQIDGYWRGDEEFGLQHLRPEAPIVRSRLPGLRPRAFLHVRNGAVEDLREVALQLDTIVLDADENHVLAQWRGHAEISNERMSEIVRLFYMHEELGQARRPNEYRALYARALIEEERDEQEFEAEEVGAPESPGELTKAALSPELLAEITALGIDPMALVEMAPPVPAPIAEQLAGARAGLDEAKTMLSDVGFEPGPAFEELERQLGALENAQRGGTSDQRSEVIARHGRGESLAEMDLEGVDLSGLELKGADFTRAMLRGVRFGGSVLDGACFEEAVLSGADLTGVSAREARFVAAEMESVVAERGVFDEAVLDRVEAERANFNGASFVRASAKHAEFGHSTFDGADLSDAKLDDADFTRARADRARFVRASMVDTWADGLHADGADFANADLTKLRASEAASFVNAVFRNVRASGGRFRAGVMTGADLSFSEFGGADFSEADLRQAKANGCVMKKAIFRGARLAGAQVLRTDLFEANFEASDLSQTDLRGSSLYGAEMWRANTDGVRLELADLTMTKLEGRS